MFVVLLIVDPSSQELGPPAIPGRFTTISAIDTPTVDIDDVDDLGEMPELGRPAISIEDLKSIIEQPRLLPSGYEVQRLDGDDFAVEEPLSRHRRRATLSREFYSNHFDHTDFWTPGSATFPIEGAPDLMLPGHAR